MKVCVCEVNFYKTTRSDEAKFHVAPPRDREKDGKPFQKIVLFIVIHFCQSTGAGAFNGNFTINSQ